MLRVTSPEAIAGALRLGGVREVFADSTTRAMYSSDASLYRIPPQVVVRPYDGDEVSAVLSFCRREGLALTSRGGGTSVAGNAIGPGVVIDFSKHMTAVLDVDVDAGTATVQPGVVQAVLQRAVAPAGLRFGPDPSTFTRCTVGGMIGNNACGSRTLGYGRTSDNVLGLRGFTGIGDELVLGHDDSESPAVDDLRTVVRANLATIRTEMGRFGRQMSGYALEHLLPERGFNLARMLVGSEGTLVVLTEATVRLVREPTHTVLVALGYDDIASAGDAAPRVLRARPTACEGIDSRIVDVVRQRRGPAAVPELPAGRAWLFVEVAGESLEDVQDRAGRVIAESGAVDARIVTEAQQQAALWRIRADGAGLSGRSPAGLPAHAGWEDAAVPPERLGDYLRDFDALMADFGFQGLPYGHFGDGCMHVRIDLPLDRAGGIAEFRTFLVAAAELVAGYGGSLSGEHGDGRARSELLPLMYSASALRMFAAVKHCFDPQNILNPGVIVDPRPFDTDLRVPAAPAIRRGLAFAYREDGGDFSRAVHRCTGIGKCRADNRTAGAVMCPSFLATREEKDSTRGRARVLQEMVNGTGIAGGWRSPEVRDALDLCLSCKGCTVDCPAGVDMPALKSEVLHQRYRRRPRPAAHYSLGWLPRWSRLAGRVPRLVNAAIQLPGIGSLLMSAAGVDPRRSVPPFAEQSFRSWFDSRAGSHENAEVPTVVLFVDSFTDHFAPEVGKAAVAVLEAAGYCVGVTSARSCCALTWISTGQLDAAKRILSRTVDDLLVASRHGRVPIVGMEPSCTAVLRSDAVELIGDRAEPVAGTVRTLAELLTEAQWEPPPLPGTKVVAQPHCHHHAVMGWDADAALLATTGAEIERLGGCCGLAGNFGVEKGHYDVSVAVAEQQLLPAVRAAGDGTVILADGYSCRTQLHDLAGQRGTHLAELLAAAIPRPGVSNM